ncbi:helix-turn-helix transcriptional regulator [Aestuariivirga sp.]|uniref:helix-turn-helix transcriptional regulator n=1 Tax=Aestuariivirga sp. TaxID=2650926 RepID=UPI00391D110F
MNLQAPFSPHRNFSDNLRALCTRHGSIAAVCRALGMNRQQFNKYLAGSTLPSSATLERICVFFAVEPQTLFSAPRHATADLPPMEPAAVELFGKLPLSALVFASGALGSMRASTLQPGCYHLYAPWLRDPGKCRRDAVYVYRQGGFTFFTRFSKFRLLGERHRYFARSRHDGIALEADRARFLLALGRQGSGEMSVIAFGAENALCPEFQNGLALSLEPSGSPLAVRTALVYRGDAGSLRRTLSETGILLRDDPAIPDEARHSLSGEAAAEPSHLRPCSLLDGLTQTLQHRL